MSSRVGLGVALAPASATFAIPFAAYYLILQNRVTVQRFATKTILGDTSANGGKNAKDPLYIAIRAQANFLENVPIAMITALLAELNGGDRRVISYALGALFALRVGHVELGLRTSEARAWGRPAGYYGTQTFLAGFAGYLAYLVKDYWMVM